jgi:DNA-binding CsgD family transcriptional regulator
LQKKTYRQIALQLRIVTRTVQAHATSLQHTFGVCNRLDLAAAAMPSAASCSRRPSPWAGPSCRPRAA